MLIKSLLIIVFSIFSPCYGGVFLHATVSLCSLFSTFLSSTMSLEERLEDLSSPEDEEEGFDLDAGELVAPETAGMVELCVVGRFLSQRAVNLNAMRLKMSEIWKLVKGVL